MQEHLDIHGKIILYEIPDWTDEELRYWMEPETALGSDGLYHIVRKPRMSEEEKRRRTVLEADNLITNAGLTNILTNISQPGIGLMQAFAQIFSLGNGACSGVLATDTSVVGDGFTTGARKAPASFYTVGPLTYVTTNYGSGDAVGTITNAGMYGVKASNGQNATTTAGTGALLTHCLFNYVKGAVSIAVIYLFRYTN